MLFAETRTDKGATAQRLADAFEKVRLLKDRIRRDQYDLTQAEHERDRAVREFEDAYRVTLPSLRS